MKGLREQNIFTEANTKIFETQKTNINGQDVYYIKFDLYNNDLIQKK